MFDLFQEPRISQGAQHDAPSWFERIRDNQRANCQRVISHYRYQGYAVPSNHWLVRLLETLPVWTSGSLMGYRDHVLDSMTTFVTALGLTSPISPGRSQYPGMLFGADSEDILIALTTDFSVGQLEQQWRNAACLRFLRHPKTDMNLIPPMGESTSIEMGPTVATIHIPMLACQYRLWQRDQMKRNPEAPRSVRQFVANIVLPNSLPSWQDVALFNQFYDRFYDRSLSSADHDHPFFLNAHMAEMQDGIDQILVLYRDRRSSFFDFIEAIGAIHQDNLRQVLKMPSFLITNQIIWALVIARIPAVKMALTWYNENERRADRDVVNELRKTMRRLRSTRGLSQLVSDDLADTVEQQLDNDIRPLL